MKEKLVPLVTYDKDGVREVIGVAALAGDGTFRITVGLKHIINTLEFSYVELSIDTNQPLGFHNERTAGPVCRKDGNVNFCVAKSCFTQVCSKKGNDGIVSG